jgi:PhnB protein
MPPSSEVGRQAITPYLSYDDAPAAIAFLAEAFGFEEHYRLPMEDGRIGHAELHFGGNVLMLASSYPEMGFAGPSKLDAVPSQLHVRVDDVDAHFDRAKAAGATIATEPSEQPHGDRSYRAIDPEGHRWIFYTPIRTMTPDEIKAAYAE